MELAEAEAASAETAKYVTEVKLLCSPQNLEQSVDLGNQILPKGSLEAVQYNVKKASARGIKLFEEVEASYQQGQISEKEMASIQQSMRGAFSTAQRELGTHTFKTGGITNMVNGFTQRFEGNLNNLQERAQKRISFRDLLTQQDPAVPPEARINIYDHLQEARNNSWEGSLAVSDFGIYKRERSISEKHYRVADDSSHIGPADAINTNFIPKKRQKFNVGSNNERLIVEEIENFEVHLPNGESHERARKISYGSDGKISSVELSDPLV